MSKKRYTTEDYHGKDVDLLEATKTSTHPKHSRKGRWIFSILVVILLAGFGFSWRVFSSANSIFVDEAQRSIIGQISGLFATNSTDLRGYDKDRINILLLGHGGPGHPGSYLSDTNILVSIKPSTKQVGMVSIPRDFAVDIPGYPSGKINNALAYGFQDGLGEDLMIDAVESVTGQEVHYFSRVDFTAFQQIIDDIGGIQVDVPTSFYDPLYPNSSYGYDPISFKAGLQTMDGETALKYARSRHGNNGEGSDFARSERQQLILFAMKEKVLSAGTLLNPTTMISIVDDLGEHMATNLAVGEINNLYELIKDIQKQDMINVVLDNSADGLLYSYISEDTGAYLLSPKAGYDDFSDIHRTVEEMFVGNPIRDESPSVEIQNGTRTAGLASQASSDLQRSGFDVVGVQNAGQRDEEDTVIYPLNNVNKPSSLAYLQQKFGATVSAEIPAWVLEGSEHASTGNIDFIIVLGKNHSGTEIESAQGPTESPSPIL